MGVLKDLRGKFVREAADLLSPRIEALLEGRDDPSAVKLERLDDPDKLANMPLDSCDLLDLCQPG
jgi:hypothetical protein